MSVSLLVVEGLHTPFVGPVSLTVAAGELVVVSGRSGAGKTLFLRALADLDPSDGKVYLNGELRDTIAPATWRRQVGLLPAEPAFWGDTVGDHFARQDERLISAVGFEGDVMAWPVARLSSGERQRLALLRLLANRPRVLLLDEPTANLDGESARQVEAVVQDYLLGAGACALWVSHKNSQIGRIAHRVVRLEAGTWVGATP